MNKIDLNNVTIPFKVRCIKADPMDDRVGTPQEKRWQVGDEITVYKVEMRTYGTFLYPNNKHNINIRRVELV